MSRTALILWLANVLLDTAGRIAFKRAAAGDPAGKTERTAARWLRLAHSLSLWAGVACFCFEFLAWLALLSLIPLSQAVLIGSINIVTVAVAGRLFFRERVAPLRMAGIAMIAVGVALAGGIP